MSWGCVCGTHLVWVRGLGGPEESACCKRDHLCPCTQSCLLSAGLLKTVTEKTFYLDLCSSRNGSFPDSSSKCFKTCTYSATSLETGKAAVSCVSLFTVTKGLSPSQRSVCWVCGSLTALLAELSWSSPWLTLVVMLSLLNSHLLQKVKWDHIKMSQDNRQGVVTCVPVKYSQKYFPFQTLLPVFYEELEIFALWECLRRWDWQLEIPDF